MADPNSSRASASRLLATGALLLFLAAASYGASFLRISPFGLTVALAIAVLKAALVTRTFMELFRERASVQLAALAAVLMVLLLVVFTAADVATRDDPPLLPAVAQQPAPG